MSLSYGDETSELRTPFLKYGHLFHITMQWHGMDEPFKREKVYLSQRLILAIMYSQDSTSYHESSMDNTLGRPGGAKPSVSFALF